MTVAVGGIQFVEPILIGDLVTVRCKLIYTGNSSMHFAVDVIACDLKNQKERLATSCVIVFVALESPDGKPTGVPIVAAGQRRGSAPGRLCGTDDGALQGDGAAGRRVQAGPAAGGLKGLSGRSGAAVRLIPEGLNLDSGSRATRQYAAPCWRAFARPARREHLARARKARVIHLWVASCSLSWRSRFRRDTQAANGGRL